MADASSYLVTTYTEVCRSHQALTEFRTKLLGLLPIASVVGLLALGKSTSGAFMLGADIIAYIATFSALFTLALFAYEARGILMCHDLYATGAALERLMDVDGQFTTCDETRQLPCYEGKQGLARKINGTVVPCAVYSLMTAAWTFPVLRFGWSIHLKWCCAWATLFAIVLTAVTSLMLRWLTKKPEEKIQAAPAPLPAT